MAEATRARERLPLPDALRGIAALALACFHFGALLPLPAPVAAMASFGWLGVDVFFVLSGFVIAGVLSARDVRFGGFLSRRLLRLMPPYLAACAAILLLDLASASTPGFRGSPWSLPSLGELVCHAAYACDGFGIDWFNPVFWSLAIEVQFYLAAVLLYLLGSPMSSTAARCVALIALAALACAAPSTWWTHYLPLFALGAAARILRSPANRTVARAIGIGTLALAAVLMPPASALVGIATALALVLAADRRAPRWCMALGTISYSLYLLHVPLGGRVVNLLSRLDPGPFGALAILAAALAASLLGAWVLWRWVELPAIARARRIPSTAVEPVAQIGVEGAR